MRRSKFSESQIATVIQRVDDGMPVADICREIGISPATYYNWRKKYREDNPQDSARIRELEAEILALKKKVAMLDLDKAMLQDAVRRRSGSAT